MTLSAKNRKILWGRSGNVCTFPGCGQRLTDSISYHDETIVIGEECHISARASGGPRAAPRDADNDVDSHVNVVLFCPTHHRIVDEQPAVFTVSVLKDMKNLHEMRVRESQRSFDLLGQLKASGADELCSGQRIVFAWRFDPSLIIVCSFGSDPQLLENGRWQGSGLAFKHIRDGRSEMLLVSSEAEPDIQYWTEGQVLCVVQHTYESGAKSLVPFVKRMFDINSYPATRSQNLLLREFPELNKELSKIMDQLRSSEYNPELSYEVLIYQLRNIGLSDPDNMKRQISALRSMKWCDGAVAEAVAAVEEELDIIHEIKSSQSK